MLATFSAAIGRATNQPQETAESMRGKNMAGSVMCRGCRKQLADNEWVRARLSILLPATSDPPDIFDVDVCPGCCASLVGSLPNWVGDMVESLFESESAAS